MVKSKLKKPKITKKSGSSKKLTQKKIRGSTDTFTTYSRVLLGSNIFEKNVLEVIQSLKCKDAKGSGVVNLPYLKQSSKTIDFLFTGFDKAGIRGYVGGKVSGNTFYTDIICAPGFGRKLNIYTTEFAKRAGCTHMALRASEAYLLRVYRRYGYARVADACAQPSRYQRAKLRELDERAVTFRGEMHGRSKQKENWDSYEGWWMSKCISSKKSIPIRKSSSNKYPSIWP
jgi:hypothetical protein